MPFIIVKRAINKLIEQKRKTKDFHTVRLLNMLLKIIYMLEVDIEVTEDLVNKTIEEDFE